MTLQEKVLADALVYGQYQLSSGQESNYFIHGDRLTLNSDHLHDFALAIWLCLDPFPNLVGGPSLGADTLVGALLILSHQRGRRLGGFLVRKDGRLEGKIEAGQTAFVIEDVMTTGQQTMNAIRAAEAKGARVLGVICLVDREAGGREMLEGAGYRLHALLTATDLGVKTLTSGSSPPAGLEA